MRSKVAYILVGTILGSIAVVGLSGKGGQEGQEGRLRVASAGRWSRDAFYFVSDSKSEGCWLIVQDTADGVAKGVSQAPRAACE